MGFWGLYSSLCIPPSPWSAGIPGACAWLCVDGNLPMHRSTLQLPKLVHVCNDSSHLVNMEGGGFFSNPPSSLGQR